MNPAATHEPGGYAMIMTSAPSREEARSLARGLVEARLAACVQLAPIESVYAWRGTVEQADEVLLMIKTSAARVDGVQAWLLARHSYETPEVVCAPLTSGSPAYLRWIDEATG